MLPCLVDGETVLIKLSYVSPKKGDIVVLHHPQKEMTIVKRVFMVRSDGWLDVRGDNFEHSTDSRHFGWVDSGRVIGKVVSRFS